MILCLVLPQYLKLVKVILTIIYLVLQTCIRVFMQRLHQNLPYGQAIKVQVFASIAYCSQITAGRIKFLVDFLYDNGQLLWMKFLRQSPGTPLIVFLFLFYALCCSRLSFIVVNDLLFFVSGFKFVPNPFYFYPLKILAYNGIRLCVILAMKFFLQGFGQHFWVILSLTQPYFIKLILQIRAIEVGESLFARFQQFQAKLSRSYVFIIQTLGHIHPIYKFAVLIPFGLTTALITTLFVYHQKYASKLLQGYFFRNCLCTQTIGLESRGIALFRQYRFICYETMLFKQ